MKRASLTWVGGFSVSLCVLGMVYAIAELFFDKRDLALPAYLVYMLIGILGGLINTTLKSHQRQISQLENK